MYLYKTIAEKQRENPKFHYSIKDLERLAKITGRDRITVDLNGQPARVRRGCVDWEWWVTPIEDTTTMYILPTKELLLNTNILDII